MNYELLNPEKSYRTFISQIKHKQFFETSKRMHDLEWFLWTGGCSTMVLHFVCVWFFNKIANMFDPKDMKWAQFLWLASFLVKTNSNCAYPSESYGVSMNNVCGWVLWLSASQLCHIRFTKKMLHVELEWKGMRGGLVSSMHTISTPHFALPFGFSSSILLNLILFARFFNLQHCYYSWEIQFYDPAC